MSTTTPEVIDNPLVKIIQESGLAPDKAEALKAALAPLVEEAGELVRQSQGITVTDATQVTEMKLARDYRLKLRDVRVRGEKARKTLKADVLAAGRIIDAASSWLSDKIEPEEKRLQNAETFAERAEFARKSALRAQREELLRPFGIDTSHYMLGDMPEATFAALLDSTRLAHEAKIAAAKKAEEEARAAQAAREAEELRIRQENDRLRAEKEAAEARAKAEREEAERKLRAAQDSANRAREAAEREAQRKTREVEAAATAERLRLQKIADAEREAREKLEREAKAKADAEAKAKADAEKARKKAERAPDADKIRTWADAILAVPGPTVRKESAATVAKIHEWIATLAKDIRDEAQDLEDGRRCGS